MKLQISDKALNATTHCEKVFSCLNEGKNNLCNVTEKGLSGVLFVECSRGINRSCYYVQNSVNKQICTCPVRKELYNKNRI